MRGLSVYARARVPQGHREEASQTSFDRGYEPRHRRAGGIGAMIGRDTNVLIRCFSRDDADFAD